MSKMPHGWYLLCDGGESEIAGELVEYLAVWASGDLDALQRHLNVDDMMHQLSQAMTGHANALSHLFRDYQMPAEWRQLIS